MKGASDDDTIRPWVQGAVDTMGAETALQLLTDVGTLE
jgi:hypothetical protein